MGCRQVDKLIEVKNVSYFYRRNAEETVLALDGVSFDVYRGEFVAVLGENGSGKSTLAKLLNGLLQPAEGGTVLVDGISTADEKSVFEVRKRVGMVFQNPDNQMVATFVEDDIAFGPENLGVPREEIEERIDEALRAVGMEGHRKSTPFKMSGGQKQRLAIAAVLAMKPDVLVLDESTSMLDPLGRREVMETLKRLNESGVTVLHVTHNMEEAFCAGRVLVLNAGKLVCDTTPEMLFSNYSFLAENKLTLPVVSEVARLLTERGVLTPSKYLTEEALADALQERLPAGLPALPRAESAQTAGEDVIVSSNLTYTYMKKTPYEKQALKGVDLNVRQGEFLGIIGATGSGKSTFIQHLNALIRVTGGSLVVAGEDLSKKKVDLRKVRGTVGMVFQYPEYQLFEETVEKDVAFGPKNLGLSPEEIDKRVRGAIEVCGLNYEEIKDRSPFELSGGQKRRVAIAGVIAMQPQILVFDEPTAGLDPCGRRDILELVKKLQGYSSPTVIMVSHNMDEIARYADRIAVFSDGAVQKLASPIEVFSDTAFLERAGLDAPVVVRMTELLRARGVQLPITLTAEEFADAACRALGGDTNA